MPGHPFPVNVSPSALVTSDSKPLASDRPAARNVYLEFAFGSGVEPEERPREARSSAGAPAPPRASGSVAPPAAVGRGGSHAKKKAAGVKRKQESKSSGGRQRGKRAVVESEEEESEEQSAEESEESSVANLSVESDAVEEVAADEKEEVAAKDEEEDDEEEVKEQLSQPREAAHKEPAATGAASRLFAEFENTAPAQLSRRTRMPTDRFVAGPAPPPRRAMAKNPPPRAATSQRGSRGGARGTERPSRAVAIKKSMKESSSGSDEEYEEEDEEEEDEEEAVPVARQKKNAKARGQTSKGGVRTSSRSRGAPRVVLDEEGESEEEESEEGESEEESDEDAEAVEETEGDEGEEWKTSGHAWVGKRVRRFFEGEASDGTITRWLPEDGEDEPLWHMEHDDGDEEDLDEEEARAAVRALKRRQTTEEAAEQGEESDEADEEVSDGEVPEGEVESVLARRRVASGVEFLVKWRGQSHLHVSWHLGGALTRTSEKSAAKLKAFSRAAPPLPVAKEAVCRFDEEGELVEEKEEEVVLDDGLPRADARPWLQPEWYAPEEVLSVRRVEADGATVEELLVKWRGLPLDQSTWERASSFAAAALEPLVGAFRAALAAPVVPPTRAQASKRPKQWEQMAESPEYGCGRTLRPYQLDGVNWMVDRWRRRCNVMLGDEMGLGKTAQIVAALHTLHTLGVPGPFLIVAPLSTIAHWSREFATWTQLRTIVLHGSASDRKMLCKYQWAAQQPTADGLACDKGYAKGYFFHVVVTTYEMLHVEGRRLAAVPWQYLVVDEAHRLKNPASRARMVIETLKYEQLALLTGTPIQNSTAELFSLLSLLNPHKFSDADAFAERFGDMKSGAQVGELQELLKPMMLRRLKEDVMGGEIPPKEETIIYVELTKEQKRLYRAILDKNVAILASSSRASSLPSLANIFMQLRKVCNHPRLLEKEDRPLPTHGSAASEMKALVAESGKMVLLAKLLPRLREEGRKVLVFSQMTRMLDLLEDYLHLADYPFERLDGSVAGKERQASIDRFQNGGPKDAFVFLLSTRAGGVGINLTAADSVVIFDSDWNPQNDVQGMARCHRIGQTQQVRIYRLITNKTYERGMFERACLKLSLDHAVLGGAGSKDDKEGSKAPNQAELSKMLRYGAYEVLRDDEEGSKALEAFQEADIDSLLETGRRVQLQCGGAGGAFSKTCFSSEDAAPELDVDDPQFWQKALPEEMRQPAERPAPIDRAARRKAMEAAYDDGGSSAVDSDFEWTLSDCEEQLAARKKLEKREKVEKRAEPLVAAAVGRRVFVRAESLVRGTYREDGKVVLDGACEEGGGDADGVVTCKAFCALAGLKKRKPLLYVLLEEDPETCLQALEDPKGAASGLYKLKQQSKRRNESKWTKAERDKATKAIFSLGLRDLSPLLLQLPGHNEAEVAAFAHAVLRASLASLQPADDAKGAKRTHADAAAAALETLGEAALELSFWEEWLPAAPSAEEAALWAAVGEDGKYVELLHRHAVANMARLLQMRALSRGVCVDPAAAGEAALSLALPDEMERALGGGYKAGGTIPARWWTAAHDRALLLHTARRGIALSETDWLELCAQPEFEAAGAVAAVKGDKEAEREAERKGGVGLKAVLLRQGVLLKRLQTLVFPASKGASAAKRAKFFGKAAAKVGAEELEAIRQAQEKQRERATCGAAREASPRRGVEVVVLDVDVEEEEGEASAAESEEDGCSVEPPSLPSLSADAVRASSTPGVNLKVPASLFRHRLVAAADGGSPMVDSPQDRSTPAASSGASGGEDSDAGGKRAKPSGERTSSGAMKKPKVESSLSKPSQVQQSAASSSSSKAASSSSSGYVASSSTSGKAAASSSAIAAASSGGKAIAIAPIVTEKALQKQSNLKNFFARP
ncbi:hypothetical protein AB1Y20_013617 [Prymnesium parvum]|uniref:Uncharacterized protein n=1 Tax=Prymnesium parvum TaxID=97485 RepID=A0AB34IG23_PRYPA